MFERVGVSMSCKNTQERARAKSSKQQQVEASISKQKQEETSKREQEQATGTRNNATVFTYFSDSFPISITVDSARFARSVSGNIVFLCISLIPHPQVCGILLIIDHI